MVFLSYSDVNNIAKEVPSGSKLAASITPIQKVNLDGTTHDGYVVCQKFLSSDDGEFVSVWTIYKIIKLSKCIYKSYVDVRYGI